MAEAAEENPAAEVDPAEPPKEKKKKPQECPECEGGAPAWMATFADLATLLMAFFVLILSFTEMEDPSIVKEIDGSMTEAFGVQYDTPSLQTPMGTSIIATQFKTTVTRMGMQSKEDTTDQEPEDIELEVSEDVSVSENLSDLENLQRTFAKELASGAVELIVEDGKIVVAVNDDAEKNERETPGDRQQDGRVSQSELNIYARVAESQAFMETELEVRNFNADTEQSQLRQARKDRELDDKYQAVRADLSSEIKQGLVMVEKVDDKILISLSAANSFRSGSAELQQGFLGTLRTVSETVESAGGNVQISGHTDDIPIAFSERFDSNWDLSAARAAAVADFLFSTSNLDNQQVSVFGYADTKPIANNATAQGRAQNRRIEILVDR